MTLIRTLSLQSTKQASQSLTSLIFYNVTTIPTCRLFCLNRRRLVSSSISWNDKWKEPKTQINIVRLKTGSWGQEDWREALQEVKKSKGYDIVWDLLDRVVLEESQRNRELITTTNHFHSGILSDVVHAWKENPGQMTATNVLDKIERYLTLIPELDLQCKIFNIIVEHAIDFEEDGAHNLAERVLHLSMKNGQDNPLLRPDSKVFNNVMLTLIKTGAPNVPQRVEALSQQMQDLTDKGWEDLKRDALTYNNIVMAWAISTDPKSVQKAEDYLKELPNPITHRFNIVLNGWAKCDDPRSAHKCAALFKSMRALQKSTGNATIKPIASTYGILIAAYANKGMATEAEAVLDELLHEYERRHDSDLLPDRIHFNSLMDAWAKSGDKFTAERAEATLLRMRKLASATNNGSLVPDVISYTSLLNAWAKSNDPVAASRAEATLQKMEKMYKSGMQDMKPNVMTYAAVLDCLAQSRSKDAASKAESILDLMIARSKAGDMDIVPDTIAFNTVIYAYSKSGDPDAAVKVQSVFDRMSSHGAIPSESTYNTMISMWTQSGDHNAGQKAENCLRGMMKRYKSGDEHSKPGRIIFNSSINAWSTSKDPTAADRARVILKMMKKMEADGHDDCSPNKITYSALLNVVARSTAKDKADKAWEILDEMAKRSLQPCDRTFGAALMACAFSRAFDRDTRVQAFKVAVKIIQRAYAETMPSSQTYGFFFTAAARLNQNKVVEGVYGWCCRAGYAEDKWIKRSLKLAAPHLLQGASPSK